MTEPDGAEPSQNGLGSRAEPGVEFSSLERHASTYQRLNEFGWNALPTYLAMLGAIFFIYGVFSGALRSVAYGALFIALGFVKRRHDGAWLRRY